MKEILVKGENLVDAYHKAILALHEEGEVLSCSDWNDSQKEVSMTFVAENPLQEPMITRCCIGGFRELQQYVMEVLDGILDFKMGEKDTWEYTYHDRITHYPMRRKINDSGDVDVTPFNQVEFVINELKRQKDSRRAVMIIRDNSVDPFNSDPACWQNAQYFIRNNKLHCKILFRSNDALQASFMNAFAFIMLQKRIADALGVEVGSYTHRANSYHAYGRTFSMLEQYVDGIKNKPLDEISYHYEGFYKDMMAESIPDINKMVEDLKSEKFCRENKNAK